MTADRHSLRKAVRTLFGRAELEDIETAEVAGGEDSVGEAADGAVAAG